jgi:hypothetical protein
MAARNLDTMNLTPIHVVLIAVCLLGVHELASAQSMTLPPASRTVYKCTVNNKVAYTDEPCVGAKVVDVEPTRGMNKSTGKELTGPDVSREKFREQLAEGIKPITGLSAQQLQVQQRRMKLSGESQAECGRLDRSIAQAEADERGSTGDAKADVQRGLFTMRKRSRELRC